jgi:hypothetical protein
MAGRVTSRKGGRATISTSAREAWTCAARRLSELGDPERSKEQRRAFCDLPMEEVMRDASAGTPLTLPAAGRQSL